MTNKINQPEKSTPDASVEGTARSYFKPPKPFFEPSPNIDDAYNWLNSTGSSIQVAIDGLSSRIDNIKNSLIDNNQISNLDERIELLGNELNGIKTEFIPQLRNAKKTIEQVEDFLKNNAAFLTNLISADGKVRSLEGEISSLSKRIEFIENKININWNRSATIWAIIISIISTLIALAALLYVFLSP